MRRLAIAAAFVLTLAAGAAGAADFKLVDTQGRSHSLADYRGKWLVLNLWATWCPPCLAEMPEFEALSQARTDLAVIGVAADGQSPQRVAEFARKLKVSYPIVAGNEELARQLGGRVYPTTLVFDPAGKQVLLREGAISRREIEDIVGR